MVSPQRWRNSQFSFCFHFLEQGQHLACCIPGEDSLVALGNTDIPVTDLEVVLSVTQ